MGQNWDPDPEDKNFPGGPLVGTHTFSAESTGSIPDWETDNKIPHGTWYGIKKKKKKTSHVQKWTSESLGIIKS